MAFEQERPDPDELLAHINENAEQQKHGKLKIFLGYVAGVGKTFAMLEAAHQRKDEGIDIVVGYVETHGRKDTEDLLKGLEIIPGQEIEYHGKKVKEMNLDSILTRHPQMVLVDELAHSNVPGMRHPKRYQDVEEILDAGINVYTTVNIQHLESLKDVIQQITGITVHETVPDRIVDEAYEIELIDLPTDELINRLRTGKVYVPDQAARALERFFRKGNLTALRELSLRRAADRVDDQMFHYMQNKSIPGPWPAADRIMVCISSQLMSEQLIRTGRRLSDDLNAEWYVVFVETPQQTQKMTHDRTILQHNMNLAEELGAQVTTLVGDSIVDSALGFAQKHNITKLIVGKHLHPHWYNLIRGSIVDQLIKKSGVIDIYVVSEKSTSTPKINQNPDKYPFKLKPYLGGLLLVILTTGLGYLLSPYLDPVNLLMFFLIAVILSAVFFGRSPTIFTSILGVLAFDFFFIEPHFTFSVNDTQYILTFIGLLIVGLVISSSAALLRDQINILRRREQQNQVLKSFSRELTAAITLSEVLHASIHHISDMFNCETMVLLPEENRLTIGSSTPNFVINESELAVASWAFKNAKEAGSGTNTLPASPIRFIPLITSHEIVGLIGIKLADSSALQSSNQKVLLEGVVNLAAIAIERASFAQKAAQTETMRNTEKLQTALLNSISHELRTPLATITGVLSSLEESEQSSSKQRLDDSVKLELIRSATSQAEQLNHIVKNLLDMTRVEAGALHLNLEPSDIQDLIGTVIHQMSSKLSSRRIEIKIPTDFPLLTIDAVLIAQVFENLLDNACKYSPPQSPITITVQQNKTDVEISVRDHGIGIPVDDLERIFDKFYRVQRQKSIAGTGLGLSICKGIIEAHGGRIWASNNSDDGMSITFTLPKPKEGTQ